jgi:imidazole glycerol-phosphate synthase subunit HisH
MIAVVDYGRGNVYSMCAAFRACGADVELTDQPERILASERVVLPGVGAFGDVVECLRARRLWQPLREVALRGTPFLGICVGMQVLADVSEEFGTHEGFGLIHGAIRRVPDYVPGDDGFRIPNVGWRPVRIHHPHAVLRDIQGGDMMYFVHSYSFQPEGRDALIASIRCNGVDVSAMVGTKNIVGCQFHPERSGPAGLRLIRGFVDWRP